MTTQRFADPRTEADIDAQANDPALRREYIVGKAAEAMGITAQDYAEAIASVANEAVDKSLLQSNVGVKERRIPMAPIDEAAATQETVRASWYGADEASFTGGMYRAAKALDGEFADLADFLTVMHPKVKERLGFDPRLKVLGEGQGDQGGFLVPDEFRNTLLSVALEAAVVRPRAFRIPMGALNLRIPTIRSTTHASNVFGGVTGYWTPESGTLTASEPTFSQVLLTAKKLIGLTSTSNELLADSAIALEAVITRLFGEALAYFEDDAFINGVGGGQPLGVLNADAIVTVAKETGQAATTIVKENLDKMFSRMLGPSRSRAVWLAHDDTIPQLFALSQSVGTGGSPVMVMNIANAPTFTIYGRPVIFTEKCQTLGTAGDIYFVDLSYYLLGDRQAMEMTASPHVRFLNDETTIRFIQRVDGRPWLDSAITPRNGTNTLTPFVNLATRA